MSTELSTVRALPPAIMGSGDTAQMCDLMQLAQLMHRSGLAPKGLGSPEAIAAAAIYGQGIGMTFNQAILSVAVIQGRPTLWGDGMLGLCRNSPVFDNERFKEYFEGAGDDLVAVCECARVGCPVSRSEFSVADAKRAGLWSKGGPWAQYPKRMLKARARAFALRDTFSDVLCGFYSREEMQDVVDVEAEVVRPAPAPTPAPEASQSEARAELEAKAAAKRKADAVASVARTVAYFEGTVSEERVLSAVGKASADDMDEESMNALRQMIARVRGGESKDVVFPLPSDIGPDPEPESDPDPDPEFPADAGWTPAMKAMLDRLLKSDPMCKESWVREIVMRNSPGGMPDGDKIEAAMNDGPRMEVGL